MTTVTVVAKWNGKEIMRKTHQVSSPMSLARLLRKYRDNAYDIGGWPTLRADINTLLTIGVRPDDVESDHVTVLGERVERHYEDGEVRPCARAY